MSDVTDQLVALAPALLFLCFGWRLARAEGVEVTLSRYLRVTVPVVAVALVAAAGSFVGVRLIFS